MERRCAISRERNRSTLPVLFSVVILDLIGFGIVMLALPFYAEELGASATTLGLIVSAYAAAQFVFAPVWGKLSDRVGRRPILLISIAGMGLSLLGLGLAQGLVGVFAARIAGGVFAANIGVASAYIADVTEAEERTRWMGVLGACFGVGFVLGPAIAGLLEPLGETLMPSRAAALPILVAAGLAALNLVWAAVTLAEPPQRSASDAGEAGSRWALLRDPEIRRLCAIFLIFSLAVTQLETTFAFFMMKRFSYDMFGVAWIFVGMAVLMGGVQGGGMKVLAARLGERKLVVVGAALCGFAFLWIPIVHAIAWLLVVLALSAVARAVVQPSLLGLTSTTGTEGNRGLVMGTFQSCGSLARVFGPALAGWLFDLQIGWPFFFAALLFVVVAVMARRLPARATEPAAALGTL